MIHRFERFCGAIADISRCWHRIAADEMEKYGLNGPHAVYLNTLYCHPEGITAAKLGELCGKNKSDVSRMIAILEEKGLVRKEHVYKNFYRARLKLTEEGRRAAEQVREKVGVAVECVERGISQESIENFNHVLNQISVNLQTLCKEGLPKNG